MKDLIEIRWHGRGGQGAKTASLLLADAAFNTGKYIQGFPEYGPERTGAPLTAYNRISTTPIINTKKSLEEIERSLKDYNGEIYAIDAKTISVETIGRYFPNTAMLAAIVKITGIMTDEDFLRDMEGSFKHKFATKPEVIEGNMKAIERALKEINKLR